MAPLGDPQSLGWGAATLPIRDRFGFAPAAGIRRARRPYGGADGAGSGEAKELTSVDLVVHRPSPSPGITRPSGHRNDERTLALQGRSRGCDGGDATSVTVATEGSTGARQVRCVRKPFQPDFSKLKVLPTAGRLDGRGHDREFRR